MWIFLNPDKVCICVYKFMQCWCIKRSWKYMNVSYHIIQPHSLNNTLTNHHRLCSLRFIISLESCKSKSCENSIGALVECVFYNQEPKHDKSQLFFIYISFDCNISHAISFHFRDKFINCFQKMVANIMQIPTQTFKKKCKTQTHSLQSPAQPSGCFQK